MRDATAAVGQSEETAELIGAQWMPTRVPAPAVQKTVSTELGGVVIDIEPGEKLYLVSSAAVDQYVAHSNRTPGVMVAENVRVALPAL